MAQNEGTCSTTNPQKVEKQAMMSQGNQLDEVTKLTELLSISKKQNAVKQLVHEIKENLGRKQYRIAGENLQMLTNYENESNKSIAQLLELCSYVGQGWLNEPEQIKLLKYIDYLLMRTISPSNRQYYWELILKITIKMLSLTEDGKEGDKKEIWESGLVCKWDNYIELLRTYTHLSMETALDQNNWLICWIMMGLMLPNAQVNPNCPACQQYPQLIGLVCNLQKQQVLQTIRQQMFHKLSLLLRIFISNIDQFMSMDNKLLLPSSQYTSINNCALLMEIIKYQIIVEPTQSNLNAYIKLDCIMLLATIAESKIKPSPNYNQILQFAIHIVLYLDEITNQTVQQAQTSNSSGFNQGIKHKTPRRRRCQLMFYCGQLVSLILYRNCHQLVKFCRKQSQTQPLTKLLKLYLNAVKEVMKNIDDLNEEQIIYKRLVLGFCGMLRINKMETVIEDTIKEMGPMIIRIIESQHGWHDEEMDQVRSEEEFIQSSEESEVEQWSENYYQKHQVASFEQVQQIDSLLSAMWGIKNHNANIFEQFMNNFDEKQSMMWMVELQKYGQQFEDDQ